MLGRLTGLTYPETPERLQYAMMWLQTQERNDNQPWHFWPWYFSHLERFEWN